MKAVIYEQFRADPEIREVPDPVPPEDGVVLAVEACGICRSDWHGWMGNDPDIELPHVPGHELAGKIAAVGKNIVNWKIGDRVTVPFVSGCGKCAYCHAGDQQICDFQFQPGFTAWGGFAEFVSLDYADTNLVRLPDEMGFVTAASLGCRFITSFRAVVDQAGLQGGEWIAVFGCGGVGLSAIMIANALGANVIAVDISNEKLDLAGSIGASHIVNSHAVEDAAAVINELTSGGADVSIDALGHPETLIQSIRSLKKRGRHIQIGILEAEHVNTPIPINLVVAKELELLGSHGMQAHRYGRMFEMMAKGKLSPEDLVGKTVTLEESINELVNMDGFSSTGITVIDRF